MRRKPIDAAMIRSLGTTIERLAFMEYLAHRRQAGDTLKTIAARIGRKPERVAQLLAKRERLMRGESARLITIDLRGLA